MIFTMIGRRHAAVLLWALALSAGCEAALAAGAPGTRPLGDEIIARGKGVEVRRRELDEAFIAFKGNAAARGQTVREEQRAQLETRLLDRLIFTQLLLQKAKPEDHAQGKEAAEKVIRQFKSEIRSEADFARQLKTLGMTTNQFYRQVTDQGICERVLDREIKDQVTITDDQLKKFYDENAEQFQQPEQVRAAHILISTKDAATNADLPEDKKKEKRALAEKVLVRAREGEDFAKLVGEYSDDPGSKARGGEYTFPRAKDDPRRAMVLEFEAAAFSLKTNQVSDIVTTRYGYHIIQARERIPAQRAPFEKVKADIKERLTQAEIQRRLPQYLENLKREAEVTVSETAIR